MLKSALIVLATVLPFAHSLQCFFNSTVTNSLYSDTGILIRAYTSHYKMGVLECSEKLTRCVNFISMEVSFFNTLDLAKDDSIFVSLIKGNNGQVYGSACMSESDCTKINAQEAEDCRGSSGLSCCCTTDECTGASGVQLTLSSLVAIALYLILH